jgi:hypothetical protein
MQAPIERILVVESSPTISDPIICQVLQPRADHASIALTGNGEQALEIARASVNGILALVSPRTSQPANQIEPSDAKG